MPNAQDILVGLLIAASAIYLVIRLRRWARRPGCGCGDGACASTAPDARYAPRIRELVQLDVKPAKTHAANGDNACQDPREPRSSPAPVAASDWQPPADSPARE